MVVQIKETKSLIFYWDGSELEFDFVIVGAGSAGCVLADRLSADGRHRVALVEAGGRDSSIWIHVPVGYFRTMGSPKTDWCYRTEPDPGLNGRSIPWPRGKVLGGSSSINGLLYVRGQAEDFDHWRQLGNTGWSWSDVLPMFRRSESWEGGASVLRGTGGPLSVSKGRLRRKVVDAWIDAAVNAGYPETDDYNGAAQEGVSYFQLTTNRGRRCSTAVAYLKPALGRRNLQVFTETHAQKLNFDSGRVANLDVTGPGGPQKLIVRKDVILSAGAVASPQLLMVSGVGDPDDLAPHGIEVQRTLPGVGKNLQDHLQARPVFKCAVSTINTEVDSLFRKAAMAIEYALFRTGPMTMAASLGAGFLKSHPKLDRPDIQFHIQPFSADSPAEGPHKFSAFTASVTQLRPESAGRIELRSAKMADHPAIHPNYLSAQKDCDTLIAGIRIARQIAKKQPLDAIITDEHAPGRAIPDDDASILDWARNTATTIYHPTGTCKMGSDPMAVVDHRLKVHGTDNLRVADASIMPTITSGNTNAPTIMIGEKASDMILEDAR